MTTTAFERMLDHADWCREQSFTLLRQSNEIYALVARYQPGLAERRAEQQPIHPPDDMALDGTTGGTAAPVGNIEEPFTP